VQGLFKPEACINVFAKPVLELKKKSYGPQGIMGIEDEALKFWLQRFILFHKTSGFTDFYRKKYEPRNSTRGRRAVWFLQTSFTPEKQ